MKTRKTARRMFLDLGWTFEEVPVKITKCTIGNITLYIEGISGEYYFNRNNNDNRPVIQNIKLLKAIETRLKEVTNEQI